MTTSELSFIIADAHVHIHDYTSINKVLDSALYNFQQAAHHITTDLKQQLGVLFLADMGDGQLFQQLSEDAQVETEQWRGDWTLKPTDEDTSVFACHKSGQQILLLAGYQIVTQENLEVLSIISTGCIENHLPLPETIRQIKDHGGLPVIPWGFGKWFGKRGKIVNHLIQSSDCTEILMGDNGNRPMFWINPIYLNQAKKQGIRILPGTDPLPIHTELSRPGSFGFYMQGVVEASTPGSCLKEMLLDAKVTLQPYGSLEKPLRFFKNQIQIRSPKKTQLSA